MDGDLGVLAQKINESLQQVASDLSPLLSFVSVDDSSYQDKYIIHPYEVFHRLSRTNIRKSVGPDYIPNWNLHDFAFALSDPICYLFNSSIHLGLVPRIWKMANVVMLPKSRKIQFGILSGPTDFRILMRESLWKTSYGCMTYLS